MFVSRFLHFLSSDISNEKNQPTISSICFFYRIGGKLSVPSIFCRSDSFLLLVEAPPITAPPHLTSSSLRGGGLHPIPPVGRDTHNLWLPQVGQPPTLEHRARATPLAALNSFTN